MRKIFIRVGIVCAWVVLIAGLVYLPNLTLFSPKEKSINIFAWGDILHPKVLEQFEKETGIKVHINYYASNEELLVKLKATRGFGYDLVIPSDYAVKKLSDEGLLKKLDKKKFRYWKELSPFLLNHSFDKGNAYSIPFSWEVFGLAIRKDFFANRTYDKSWSLIFNPPFPYKLTVSNDPLMTTSMGALYLFNNQKMLNAKEQEALTSLLIKQKKWVEAYNETRVDYFLATGSCPIGVTSSSYVLRSKKQFSSLGFIIPKEGSFISIENICIPLNSSKDKIVYELINFLYSPESLKTHHDSYAFFPASHSALSALDLGDEEREIVEHVEKHFDKLYFTQSVLSPQELKDLWIRVMTSEN